MPAIEFTEQVRPTHTDPHYTLRDCAAFALILAVLAAFLWIGLPWLDALSQAEPISQDAPRF